MGWKAKSMLEMDLSWIRNDMVCLDGGWLLMEGKYQLYNVVGYWTWKPVEKGVTKTGSCYGGDALS